MSESQNLAQQIQEQTIKCAQDLYGESLGRINSQLQGNRSQLESLAEQIPDEQAQEAVGQVAGQAEEAAGAVTGDEDK